MKHGTFRVSKDKFLNIYFLHRKFLFFWFKYVHKSNINKNNSNLSKLSVYESMKDGKYIFSRGERINYLISKDTGELKVKYYENEKDFFEKNVEDFI